MSHFHFTFSYQHHGAEKKELGLLRFTGQETLSELFNFDIELKSQDIELDEDGVINQPCRIDIFYANSITPIRTVYGFINEFEDLNYLPDYTLYRAKVVPRIWQLGHFETNEVYLNESIDQTLTTVLEEAGFILGQDFRFELNRTYRAWPFRLQYNETHLHFLQRIIEREGIYYYFEHINDRDSIVFCDNNQALPSIVQLEEAEKVNFQANSGQYAGSNANTVSSIICKRRTLPKKVTLRDFNDETPSLDIRGEFEINAKGIGDINLYGLNITSPEEGQELAEIHANAYLCRQKSYTGQGDVATMTIGHTFKLQDHPRAVFNELGFLLENIEHEGANIHQYPNLQANEVAPVNYINSFIALSTEFVFAPKRQTIAPEINGTLNAVVDTEAHSKYAELDEYGRYKIKLLFDRKDRDGGKASHWVRMMQPYGGAGEGMHFPLRSGTRVLLGFIGGDPDRPFISGTINDSGEQQSIVTAENQTNNLIKTASGNKIELEDKEGKNRIKLETGDNNTYMHLGAPNHPGDGWVVISSGMERKEITGGLQTIIIAKPSRREASNTVSTKHFSDQTATVGDELVNEQNYFTFKIKDDVGVGTDRMTRDTELAGNYLIERRAGDLYRWTEGNEFIYGADNVYNFGNGHEEFHVNEDGIDFNKEFFAVPRGELPSPNLGLIPQIRNARGHLKTAEGDQYDWGDDTRIIDPENQMVEMKWGDEFSYHHGRRFDWSSDPADYNFGNGYTENLLNSNTEEINATHVHDKATPGGPKFGTIDGDLVKGLVAGSISAEKTIGDSYSYRKGKSLDVVVGDSESYMFGNTRDKIVGNSHTSVQGNSDEIITGNSNSVVNGNAFSRVWANTDTIVYGATSEIFLGGTSDIMVGGDSTVFVSLSTEIHVGINVEIDIGPSISVSVGPHIEVEKLGLTTKAVEMDALVTKIDTIATSVDALGTELAKKGASIDAAVIKIQQTVSVHLMS